MLDPRTYVNRIEQNPVIPRGKEERFGGYGVMAVPYVDGHLLALRRFTSSSLGEGYTSIWYRQPDGKWIFYQDKPPQKACPRYFSSVLSEYHTVEKIDLSWLDSHTLRVSIKDS